jgi:hypothetical protein
LLSVVAALENLARGGDQWTSGENPTFSHQVGQHRTLIMLKTTPAILANDVTTQAFWELHHGPAQAPPMERFKVLDADVALLLVLLNMSLPKEADGSVWIWPEHFLSARDRAPKKTKAASDGLHSIRTADKEAIVASLERLTLLHIAGKTVVQRKRIDILEGPFFQVEQRWLYWIKSAERPRPSVMAERIRMGHWIDPFLRSGLQTQMGIYIQKVLSYDPYHDPWEKGLGHYFSFNLYFVSAAGYRTLTISVGELLDACSLPVDPLHPYQALLAFNGAMDRLDQDNVIADWDYEDNFDPEKLPSKDWLRTWRSQRVTVAVGSLLMEHGYQEMIKRGEMRRFRRKQRLQQMNKLTGAAQEPHEEPC